MHPAGAVVRRAHVQPVSPSSQHQHIITGIELEQHFALQAWLQPHVALSAYRQAECHREQDFPLAVAGGGGSLIPRAADELPRLAQGLPARCPPWRAKRRRVVPGSREATRDTRRAEGAKGDPKGASERGVQSYGRPVCSRNELAMLWRNAG